MNKNIVILDGKSLGDISYEKLNKYGNYTYYDTTSYEEVSTRIKDAHIIFTNKVVLDKVNLAAAENLELICEVATGFNNIDIEYAKERGIAVTNVAGYSTSTVVQHTFATALSLMDEVLYYDKFVKSGEYSKCRFFTCLDKPFNEIEGKTWGIICRTAIYHELFPMCLESWTYLAERTCMTSALTTRVSAGQCVRATPVITPMAPPLQAMEIKIRRIR